MTDLDLARLKQLADGAAPGPWEAFEDSCSECRKRGESEAFISGLSGGYHAPFGRLQDAAYIAALSPDVATALIERIERAEAALKLAHPYVEQAIKDDGGIENCEIGDRLALEKIRTALAALEAS